MTRARKTIMVAALTLIFLGAMAAPSFAHYMASSTLAVNSAVSGGDAEQQRGLKLSPQRIPSGSLSVLRKYLPSVIAIHKAENLSEEEIDENAKAKNTDSDGPKSPIADSLPPGKR